MATVRYESYLWAWHEFTAVVAGLIDRNEARRVCEIGGGGRPMLTPEMIEQAGLDYSVLDISESELAKSPRDHGRIVADVASADFAVTARFDLVFSRMLAEHVADAERFHRNTRALLRDGGIAVHFLPTLFSSPFVFNRLLPSAVSTPIVNLVNRSTSGPRGKFPAYYRWCRGPVPRQLERLESVGFEVVEYVGVFGHDYYRKIPLLHRLEARKEAYLLAHPHPALTSYAVVTMRRR